MRFFLIIVVVVLIGTAVVGPQFFFTVDETQHVVITRFGEVQRIVSTPGLKTKAAFVDTVNVLDKRILRVDVTPISMPDQDNQFLEIDAYARYRIIDPKKFIEKLRDETTAASRIGQIVISQLRSEIGNKKQPEIIGGQLVEIREDRTVVDPLLEDDGTATRAAITRRVRDSSDQVVKSPENDFGIEIVDVRIKRADYPAATEENIFNRMRSKRAVLADGLRAEGDEEFLTRTAIVDRQVEVIRAEADEESNQLRGEGEGEAIRILAQALEQDPELFSFLRSLEAYRAFLGGRTTAVLTADSDLFQYLQSPDAPTPTPTP